LFGTRLLQIVTVGNYLVLLFTYTTRYAYFLLLARCAAPARFHTLVAPNLPYKSRTRLVDHSYTEDFADRERRNYCVAEAGMGMSG
jgi:hypothetical protein